MIQHRAKDPDDELELVIVQSMWLTGFDSPPLHTLYLDRPMRGAALMQALARVNRTFRDKQDGLLVGYAPLTENLYAALAEYTASDQHTKPLGRDIDEAVAKVRDLLDTIGDEILAGYDWRHAQRGQGRRGRTSTRSLGAVNYLRDPATPGNQVAEGEPTLGERFRPAAAQLARLYALCSSHKEMRRLPGRHRVLRGGPGLDGQVRRRGPAGPRRCPSPPTSSCTCASSPPERDRGRRRHRHLRGRRDSAAPTCRTWTRRSSSGCSRPATRTWPSRRCAGSSSRRCARSPGTTSSGSRASPTGSPTLMTRYTNQNLTAAQVIAELVAMAKEVSADANRGQQFTPPLTSDELAFYDAVAQNESAVTEMGTGVLADIARDLVRSLRRDVTTDWVSRDDVRAKLRSTIKRLLARYGYPPDAQPAATELVLRQMETFADEWSPEAGW